MTINDSPFIDSAMIYSYDHALVCFVRIVHTVTAPGNITFLYLTDSTVAFTWDADLEIICSRFGISGCPR